MSNPPLDGLSACWLPPELGGAIVVVSFCHLQASSTPGKLARPFFASGDQQSIVHQPAPANSYCSASFAPYANVPTSETSRCVNSCERAFPLRIMGNLGRA